MTGRQNLDVRAADINDQNSDRSNVAATPTNLMR
jgi:hypothetical protein